MGVYHFPELLLTHLRHHSQNSCMRHDLQEGKKVRIKEFERFNLDFPLNLKQHKLTSEISMSHYLNQINCNFRGKCSFLRNNVHSLPMLISMLTLATLACSGPCRPQLKRGVEIELAVCEIFH